MYSLAALVRPGVGTRTRIAAASPAALGHSPQQHPHSYAAILYKTNTHYISSLLMYCICTIIIRSHPRQEIRFHSFRRELKKSLKLEPDNQPANKKFQIASIDNELCEDESELCSYHHSIWRPYLMKEIVFFLKEWLRLVIHQNKDSSIEEFRPGVKIRPQRGSAS